MKFFSVTILLTALTAVDSVSVSIDTANAIFTVDPTFVSYCVDAYLLSTEPRWMNFNFSSPKLQFLMKELSPAILRFGGSPADWTVFSDLKTQAILNATGTQPGVTIFTKSDFDNMVKLTRSTGNKFLYDLNLQLRYGKQWDPTNTIEIFNYLQEKNYGDNVDFELGNEPGVYGRPGQVVMDPEQIGSDYESLFHLIKQYPNLAGSSLVGPDEVGVTSGRGSKIIQQVAEKAGQDMRAITIHHYYFRGDTASLKDFIDPSKFSSLQSTIQGALGIIKNTSNPQVPLWIGETADAWHSGTENVTDRFISTFLWLEKLGLSASLGVSTVMRQTLYGHYYGLIDEQLNPNPDYWVSWLHKQLVGERVLEVMMSGPLSTRVYAHCTNTKRTTYPAGSITLFALNVNQTEAEVLDLGSSWANQVVDVYYLAPPVGDPGGLLSKFISVNGHRLLVNGSQMPRVNPDTMKVGPGISLPPLSLLFAVFPNANTLACM